MTIAEVAKKYDMSADTLRYYERIGLIPAVGRSKGGIRNYTDEDCRWIGFIKRMRSAGLTREVLSEYVRLFQQGDETVEARKNLLVAQREQLSARIQEMERTLKRLDDKITHYEMTVMQGENRLKKQEGAR